jgi:hypothetical protein
LATKKDSKKDELHQGNLLRKLADWYGKSDESFAELIGYSAKTFYNLLKLERMPQKNQINICRALGIPTIYFLSKYDLPLHPPSIVSEPSAEMVSDSVKKLREENAQLHKELHDAWKKIAQLQENIYQKGNT